MKAEEKLLLRRALHTVLLISPIGWLFVLWFSNQIGKSLFAKQVQDVLSLRYCLITWMKLEHSFPCCYINTGRFDGVQRGNAEWMIKINKNKELKVTAKTTTTAYLLCCARNRESYVHIKCWKWVCFCLHMCTHWNTLAFFPYLFYSFYSSAFCAHNYPILWMCLSFVFKFARWWFCRSTNKSQLHFKTNKILQNKGYLL